MLENTTLSKLYVIFFCSVKRMGKVLPILLNLRLIVYYNVNMYNLRITN